MTTPQIILCIDNDTNGDILVLLPQRHAYLRSLDQKTCTLIPSITEWLTQNPQLSLTEIWECIQCLQ